MYKLHYDVDAGKQLNVVYEGVEFEVQAGTGGGSDVEVETNKEVTITENGTVEITPSIDKDAMAKVTATVNVPTSDVEIQEYRQRTFTENGIYEITPWDDYVAMAKVEVTVAVPFYWKSSNKAVGIDYTVGGIYEYIGSQTDVCVYGRGYSESPASLVVRGGNNFRSVTFGSGFVGWDESEWYNFMEFHCQKLILSGVSIPPVRSFKVYGEFEVDGNCVIGGEMGYSEVEVYGEFNLRGNLSLKNTILYIYTNTITVWPGAVLNDFTGSYGEVHVLTDCDEETIGGHAVIKDLDRPE